MRKLSWICLLLVLFALPAGIALASFPSVEAGGYLYIPKLAITDTNTAGPQIDSKSTGPLELRTRASATTDGHFRFYAHNAVSSGGFLFKFSEQAGTSVSDRMSMDHDGTLRLYPDGSFGAHLELFGGVKSTNGGSDGPVRIYGGSATTAFTGRLVGVRKAVGDVEVYNIRADGTAQWIGVATASLGTCNGSAEGGFIYDTDVNAFKLCDATAWRQIPFTLPFSAAQDVPEVAAQDCEEFSVTATGVVDGDVAACDPPTLDDGLVPYCDTRTDAIRWHVCNITAAPINPASLTYTAKVIRP